jgi:peroxiredoxin
LDQARDEIRAAGGDVVAIFHYRAGPTRNFCRQREVELDCYGDPEMEGYLATGLDQFSVREAVSPKIALGAIRAAGKGAIAGVPKGNLNQRPGTFVVGTDGSVLFAHYNRDQSDNPDVADVVEAVRAGAAQD